MAKPKTNNQSQNLKNKEEIPSIMPVLPYAMLCCFSHDFSVLVGRESLKAATDAIENINTFSCRTKSNVDDIIRRCISRRDNCENFPVFKTPNGLMKILVDGVVQADIGRFTNSSPFLEAEVFISTPLLEPSNDLDTWRVLHRHYLQNVFI